MLNIFSLIRLQNIANNGYKFALNLFLLADRFLLVQSPSSVSASRRYRDTRDGLDPSAGRRLFARELGPEQRSGGARDRPIHHLAGTSDGLQDRRTPHQAIEENNGARFGQQI